MDAVVEEDGQRVVGEVVGEAEVEDDDPGRGREPFTLELDPLLVRAVAGHAQVHDVEARLEEVELRGQGRAVVHVETEGDGVAQGDEPRTSGDGGRPAHAPPLRVDRDATGGNGQRDPRPQLPPVDLGIGVQAGHQLGSGGAGTGGGPPPAERGLRRRRAGRGRPGSPLPPAAARGARVLGAPGSAAGVGGFRVAARRRRVVEVVEVARRAARPFCVPAVLPRGDAHGVRREGLARGRPRPGSPPARPACVTCMSRSRRGAPPRKPFVYQELCLRNARMAPLLARARPPAGARARASRPPRRRGRAGSAGSRPVEHVGQVAEEPGPAQAAAADDHAVAAGGAHHAQRVLRLPDVAVAEHGDRASPRCLSRATASQRACAVVELGGGARVQADGGAALLLARCARSRGRCGGRSSMPDAELDGDRHGARAPHRGAHDVAQQPRLERDGGARRPCSSPCAPGSRSSCRCGRRGPRPRARAPPRPRSADRRRRAAGCASSPRAPKLAMSTVLRLPSTSARAVIISLT